MKASIAGGWFDNWCVYHRIPDGIAQWPAATTWRRRLHQRIGAALSRHASGWGTSVSLVSFACSLFSAARAYELPAHDVFGMLKGIGRRLRRSPLSFVRPPRPSPTE